MSEKIKDVEVLIRLATLERVRGSKDRLTFRVCV